MVLSTSMLLDRFSSYGDPFGKISRMVKSGKLFPLTKGIYEDNRNSSPYCLAQVIYGPSYISFDTALAYYGLIPEAVYSFTSATSGKGKKKLYRNIFGTFTYRDIPMAAFPYGISVVREGDYRFMIATREKAICDRLYELPVIKNQKELKYILFEDLRIDEDLFQKLNREDIYFIAGRYHSGNVSLLEKYPRRLNHE